MESTRQPTSEELKAAIEQHVRQSKEAVAKIPLEQRTIVTKEEAKQLQALREQRDGSYSSH